MNLTDDTDLLQGYDWLQHHNPQIDWESGTFTLKKCPDSCLNKWDRQFNKDNKLYIMDIQWYLEKKNNLWKVRETVTKKHHK